MLVGADGVEGWTRWTNPKKVKLQKVQFDSF